MDLSHKSLRGLIEPADLERALSQVGLEIEPGDTVLLYTDHYRRAFGTADWHHGPGVSADAARWLGSFSLYWSAAQDPRWNRLAGAGRCGLRELRQMELAELDRAGAMGARRSSRKD